MICLKCDEDKKLFIKTVLEDSTVKGFCEECWKIVNQSGKCITCGVEEGLLISAMWNGIAIEHTCDYCRATAG